MKKHTASILAAAPFVALALAWAAPAAALTKQEIALLPDAGRQAILEQGAKSEGALVWYSTMPTDSASRPITNLFMKKYPFLKAEFVSAASEEIVQRSQAEFRARSVRVDIMTASVADSLGKTGLIQKFRSPETAKLPAQYVDPEGFWVSIRTIWTGVGWNTKRVSAADAPKTWEDLANPNTRD